MIATFYDKNFKALQNNATLVIDRDSYSLSVRPIEPNELSCVCEAFTENIQPAFLVIKNDIGGYIYGCLAGIPYLTADNKTQINGTDAKTMLSSEIDVNTYNEIFSNVSDYFNYIFDKWKIQVNGTTIACELKYELGADSVAMSSEFLHPANENEYKIINVYEEMKSYMRMYNLYMRTQIDIVNKKVIFYVGRSNFESVNVKLWEVGVLNYGKWIAPINVSEAVYGEYHTNAATFVLTSSGAIATSISNADIFPIKKTVQYSEKYNESIQKALEKLLENRYNESIEINDTKIKAELGVTYAVYVSRGENKYKDLPLGEIKYNSSGIKSFSIGYRYDDVLLI